MKKILFTSVLCHLTFYIFSQSSSLDATHIADTYSNSIVKILLFDSIAEKNQPGSGYIGRGSGFLVTEDGLIFTNRHTVEYCAFGYMDYIYNDPTTYEELRTISVYSQDRINDPATKKVIRTGHTAAIIQVYTGKGSDEYKLYYAKALAMDVGAFDGAVLKIVSDINKIPVSEKFHPVPIGNSDSTKQGEDLCLYGFPAQFDAGFSLTLQDMSTLTFGKHSGFDFVFNKDYGYIKTDASINSGNSGGPVFNKENKVIGIATATGNKTNIGLIGGINGMYNIVKSFPDLFSQLKQKGLSPPPAKAETGSSIVTGSKRFVIGQKKLKRIVVGKKVERQFQSGTFYIKLHYSSLPKDKYTLEALPDLPLTEPGKPIALASTSSEGIAFGYLFPLWKMSPHAKLSLDYTFVGGDWYFLDWSRIKLDSIPADSIEYGTNASPPALGKFYMRLGPAFSFLFFKRVVLDVYYQLSPTYLFFNDDALVYYTSKGKETLTLTNSIGLDHVIGGSIRYRAVSIGAEYVFSGAHKLDYLLERNGALSQNPAGTMKTNMFLFTLGVGLGSKDKE